MLIDLTMKVTPQILDAAGKNDKKAFLGHIGTHFDAMKLEFPLAYTERSGLIFDVSDQLDKEIDLDEQSFALIEKDMFVVFYTGFIEDEGYGSEKYFKEHPVLSMRLIHALVARGVSMIGLDFAGVRRGEEHTPVDQLCADQGVFIVENLCNLKLVLDHCKQPFIARTFPVNYAELTGLPCRVVAECG